MTSVGEWKVPAAVQPRAEDYAYDLDAALASTVGLRCVIPANAFTAETLGTERAGHGVVIRDNGLILTVGYLITEAETIWVHASDGRVIPGHALAIDQDTGFGLVQTLGRLDLPALPFGRSAAVGSGDRVVIAGSGGRERAIAASVVGKQEFAGYWEYVLDEAIFTAPAHPNWGGTAMIGADGRLLGIGSLQLERGEEAEGQYLNMVIPIDLLPPILDKLLTTGQSGRPARPWLGVYSTEIEDRIVIVGLAVNGPAARADLRAGDIIVGVDGEEVSDLATLYRRIWSLGDAGVEIPLTIYRDGDTFDVGVNSGERAKFLKTPKMH